MLPRGERRYRLSLVYSPPASWRIHIFRLRHVILVGFIGTVCTDWIIYRRRDARDVSEEMDRD